MPNAKSKLKKILKVAILFLFVQTAAFLTAQTTERAEIVVQTGHPDGVDTIAFSTDGKLLASGGLDRTVKLWDLSTSKELRTLKMVENYADSIVFSPDNRFLATVEFRDEWLTLWDVNTGNAKWTAASGYGGVSFSSQGKFVVSEFGIWDVGSGEIPAFLDIRVKEGEPPDFGPISMSSDGRTIAIAKGDSAIEIWNLITETRSSKVEISAGRISSLAISPDGKKLACACADKRTLLWELKTGKQIGNAFETEKAVIDLGFSPDGRFLLINDSIWDIALVERIALPGQAEEPESLTFSPDGKSLATVDAEGLMHLWDLETRKEVLVSPNECPAQNCPPFKPHFSPNGMFVVFWSHLWNIGNREEASYLGKKGDFRASAFSSDGNVLALYRPENVPIRQIAYADLSEEIELWDLRTERKRASLRAQAIALYSVSISADGNHLASGDASGALKLWNIEDLRNSKNLRKEGDYVGDFVFSPDGRTIAGHEMRPSGFGITLWDTESGGIIWDLETENDNFGTLAFSPKGNYLTFGGEAWEVESGQKLEIGSPAAGIERIAFSNDESTIAIGIRRERDVYPFFDLYLKVRELATGQEVVLEDVGTDYGSGILVFSPDGTKIVGAGTGYPYLIIWDASSGKVVRKIDDEFDRLKAVTPESVLFSPDDSIVAADRGANLPIGLWNVATGEEVEYEELPDWVRFSGSFATGEINGEMVRVEVKGAWLNLRDPKDWIVRTDLGDLIDHEDAYQGKPRVSVVPIGKNDWAVTTPEGLYDASPGARDQLHYVVGLEPVTLEQMKGVYYVPGLLSKVLSGEPLPKVELFTSKDLFPETEFTFREEEKLLDIRMRDRGGGIGPVQVLVNGKEFVGDARPEDFDAESKEAKLTVNLEGAPFRTRAGEENRIEVVARNREGSLTSRGTPKGSETIEVAGTGGNPEPPDIYAIVGGVSDYTGDGLDLRFAAKDAEDFAKAVELGAVRLTGDAKKVHIRLLTSSGEVPEVGFTVPDSKVTTARKEDFRQAFEEFSGAKPDDIFIVYLSGHGTSVNLNSDPMRAGGDLYLYMTQEATSTSRDVLVVKTSREAMTLSSEELRELMKKNNALKQILVLDTCAAGAAVESFVGKRDLPSDQIKALEILKDNMGFYVLMGSAADRVSYEASRYGQGLLTYSLLQGMKGAKLKDGGYAYVGELFSYAQDTVPQMAVNIGGVQKPLVIAPDASGNFPFGRFTDEEQRQIRLSSPKPQILRPSLQNEKLRFDNLKLEQLLTQKLREMSFVSARGKNQAPLVFIDAQEMPDAIRPSGSYTVENESIVFRLVLVKGNETLGEEIVLQGSKGKLDEAMDKIVEHILAAVPVN